MGVCHFFLSFLKKGIFMFIGGFYLAKLKTFYVYVCKNLFILVCILNKKERKLFSLNNRIKRIQKSNVKLNKTTTIRFKLI